MSSSTQHQVSNASNDLKPILVRFCPFPTGKLIRAENSAKLASFELVTRKTNYGLDNIRDHIHG